DSVTSSLMSCRGGTSMKFRNAIILSCAVLGFGALTWHLYQRAFPVNETEEPFVPTLPVGAVVSVDEYRLSGPYTHDNLTVFLVHGRTTLEGTEFLTLEEALREQKAIMHETGSVS